MASNAREAALKAVGAFRRSGAWPEDLLNSIIVKEGLSDLDAALASRLCYGVLQNRLLCDYYISRFSSIKINKIEPKVMDILELSVYQLLFTDKIPPSAVVNEAVKLTKRSACPRASGFVNALLRRISENIDSLPEVEADTAEKMLSIKYSHPLPLIKLLGSFMEPAEVERLLAANNEIVPLTAQANTLRSDAEAVVSALESDGAEVERHPWLSDCVLIKGGGSPERLRAFRDGLFYIQDAASRLAVMAASPEPGQTVLDACSAPGGKAFAAALLMRNSGRIVAADIHEKKLMRIREGARRLGIGSIDAALMDASEPMPELKGKFDLVIADVPCSGLGVIRKKPEIRFKSLDDLRLLPEIQSRIIDNLAEYVRPGGVLMYSTCTILPDENENVVNAFLSRRSGFTPEPFALPGPIGEARTGMLTLLPHIHGTDGFFMCKLRKK